MLETKEYAESEIKSYLSKIGFRIFSSDEEYFIDEYKKNYAVGSQLINVESATRNGENVRYDSARGVREIKPEHDIYFLKFEDWICMLGCNLTGGEDIEFVGKSPSKTAYNAAYIMKPVIWSTGHGGTAIFPVLMLKYRVEISDNYTKDDTKQEKRQCSDDFFLAF